MAKLSVIIPFFNTEPYLEQAINSLIEQSYRDIKIIAVDDGSNDKSSEIIKKYKNIIYLRQENSGPASARNLGIKAAQTEYIGFHDADDICEKNRFELQMQLLEDNKNLEVVYTRIQNFIEPNTDVAKYLKSPELMIPRMGFISSAVMKKNCFDKVGLFNVELKIGEDVEWVMRAKNLSACCIPDVLIRRRLHNNNLSKDLNLGHKNLAKILMNKIKEEAPS